VKKSNIGNFRHRVIIQNYTRTSDGQGGYTKVWADVQTVWAEIEPVFNVTQTKEANVAEQKKPVQTHKVRIRYNPIMTPDKRLKWGNRILEPRSAIDEDGTTTTMLLFCDEKL